MRNRTLMIWQILLCSCVLQITSTTVSAVTINLSLSDSSIHVGEGFSMDIIAEDVFAGLDVFEEVVAFGFDVFVSDSTLVSYLGASVSSPFDDDSVFFPNTDVAGSTFPGIANDGLNDTIQLATLEFAAIASGPLSLGIVSDANGFNEGLIYLISGNVDISTTTALIVGEPSSIPEPNTLLLALVGILGVGCASRVLRGIRASALQCAQADPEVRARPTQ